MATALKNLRLREVSLVDRGANQHAHVSLFKGRDGDRPTDGEDMFKTQEEFDAAVKTAVTKALEGGSNDEKTKKAVEEALAKALKPHADDVAKLTRENALLKMSPAHREYMSVMKMDQAAQDAFVAKSEHDRETQVRAEPVEKALPAHIQKQLDDAAADREVLKALKEKDEVQTFAKRATDLGLPEAFGAIMRKAYAGDAASITKMEQAVKGLVEQGKMAKVFSEFGTTHGDDRDLTANEKLQKKADEFRETPVGKSMTQAQAFAKVYELPENAELREQAKREDMDRNRR